MSLKARHVILDVANKNNILKPIEGKAAAKLKEVSTKMLADVMSVFEQHGLQAFVAYGTALGAYRHKGFIPWDDDIDIAMPRNDYNYLRENFSEMFGDRYDYEAPKYKDKDTCTFWGKIYLPNSKFVEITNINTPYNKGIFIDVFPIDGLNDNCLVRWFDIKVCTFMRFIANSMTYYNYPSEDLESVLSFSTKTKLYLYFRKIIGFVFSWVSHRRWSCWYDSFISRYTQSKETICTYEDSISVRGGWFPLKKIQFEDIEVNVPHNIESYLTTNYGPLFMELPPEEKRERHFCVELIIDGVKYI